MSTWTNMVLEGLAHDRRALVIYRARVIDVLLVASTPVHLSLPLTEGPAPFRGRPCHPFESSERYAFENYGCDPVIDQAPDPEVDSTKKL